MWVTMTFTLELIIHYVLLILFLNLYTVVLKEAWTNNSYWLANFELPHSTKHYHLLIH